MSDKESNGSYQHILKYVSLFGSVQGLSILLGIVRNKLVTVILGPLGLGLISLYNSTIKMVGDLTNLGLSVSAVKQASSSYDSGQPDQVDHSVMLIRSWSLVTALLGMLVCIVFSPLLDRATFDWGNHVLHFMLLSPVVFMTAITGGEVAILKGTRQIGALARVSIYGIAGALVVSVPIYFFFGMKGIVPSLILIALVQLLLTVNFSYRRFPLKLSFSSKLFSESLHLIRLGLAFVLAGVLASVADFTIRATLNRYADSALLAYYNAGYMITFVYGGVIFSSLDSDYFPRLAGMGRVDGTFRSAVNRQIEISLLITGPLLSALLVGMPFVLWLLYRSDFLIALPMARLLSVTLLLRAAYLPIEYISLARGDSSVFFVQEFFSCLMLVVGALGGYHLCGLTGIGWGITSGALVELLFVLVYSRLKYGYVPSAKSVGYFLVMAVFSLSTLFVVFRTDGLMSWLLGVLFVFLCMIFSWSFIRRNLSHQQNL